jgi:hypothetical protein
MDKNEELQKWLNDDRYVQLDKLAEMYDCNIPAMKERLRNRGILGVKKIKIGFGGKSYCFYDKKDCIRLLNLPSKSAQSRDCQIKKYLNDKQFVQLHEISKSWGLTKQGARAYLANSGIKPIKKIYIPQGGSYAFYLEVECRNARQSFLSKKEYIENTMIENPIYITTKELSNLWGISEKGVGAFLARMKIKHVKAINMGYPLGLCTIYDRAECERARPFINQSEQKEVEKVEEKQMELPKQKEQTPDIIPADTIDLLTMSELESELKQRGVELTAEVRAKINASDMPDMKHIAKMLRGNAKTITIRLSVLNEIAEQLRGVVENNDTDQDFEREKKEEPNAAMLIDRLDAKLCQIDSAMNQLRVESAEIRMLVAEIKIAISPQLC